MALDARKKRILEAVVEQFIHTGEPVGSKFVADAMDNVVSSATIRNDMAALENAGLLEQPHTSSGRVPTHMGYRVYVDEMMKIIPLTLSRRAEIDALFNVRNADPDRLLEDAAAALASITGLATFSTTMIPSTVTVKKIEIIPAGARTVVIMLIASSGVVKFAQTRLEGKSIEDITSSYLSAVSVQLGDYSRLFMPVFSALYDLVKEINEGQYFTKGAVNLLSFPELSRAAYDLLGFIERRQEMLDIMSHSASPVQVMIGRETLASPLAESSVLIARYNIGQNAAGAIGVIGPVRMDYAELLPHVEYFARTLGKLLSETYNE